jgi:RNA polymerase sigma factor (sigma-70 family)
MERLQRGDPRAFDALHARYRAGVWSFLRRHCQDEPTARELYQDTFFKVWRGAATWRPGNAVRPWLYRIAANAARDAHRARGRQVTLLDLDPDDVGRGVGSDPVDAVALSRAIEQLPVPLREAFLLGAVHGLDHQELAVALDVTPDNARARLSRARARLRALLTAQDS